MTQLFDTRPANVVGYAHVALEQGIDTAAAGLTYAIPEALADLAVGDRVTVPLGRSNKPVAGYVIERVAQRDHQGAGIKLILDRDEHALSLTPDLVELARWMAGYYCCPLGMVLVSMLPAAVKRGIGTVRQTVVRAPANPKPETRNPKLSKLQAAVLVVAEQRAATSEPWIEIKELADLSGARSISPVRQLLDKGLLEARQQPTVRAALDEAAQRVEIGARDMTLTASQQRALDRLAGRVGQGFSVHLLHGVTGSGKTEVYLRVIEHVLASRGVSPSESRGVSPRSWPTPSDSPGAIVLVPEIALTPQMVRRFVGRFAPGDVAVLHSGLTDAQRHEQWRRIRHGQARIVVGARSAVFAPLHQPAVLIVDEEHDSSYKQDQAPRYHARDLAIKRAQLLNIPVVLGSATPSLESYYNATHRKSYHLLRLPDRVAGLRLPTVQIVDMRQQRRARYELTGKAGVHLLSLPLEKQLQSTLAAGGQAMLLLNRRGYANYIACPDHACGWMMNCADCDAMMVYHKDQHLPTGGYVRCHHCLAEQLLPKVCPTCGKKVTVFGLGTQRVEEELARKLPGVTVRRMDSDTMRSSRDYYQTLEAFGSGEVKVLVGTQMIAKGLDFPNVKLVGVVSADTALHLPDFRAAERTFQLIAQVAGRAGRGDPKQPGTVILQTFNPEDPAIVLASRHDYEAFADREIALRAQVGLPPVGRMARIVVRDRDKLACLQQARALADHLAQSNEQLGGTVKVRGPAACPVARIAGYHRQQIQLLAPPPDGAASIQKLLTALRNARLLRSDAHTAVDVDPVALL